jgi:hypothetical protein
LPPASRNATGLVVLTIVYFAGLALLAYSAGQSFNFFG